MGGLGGKHAPFFNADGTVKEFAAQDSAVQNSGDYAIQNKNLAADRGEGIGRYKIVTDRNGNQYVQADRQVITGDNPEVWKTQITQYINDVIRQGKDLQIKTVEGDTVTITKNTAGKAAFQNAGLSNNGFKTKLNAEAHIDELSEISKAQKNPDGTKKITPDHGNKHAKRNLAKDGWSYRTAYFKDFSGKLYKVQLSVAIDGTVESIYNVGTIKEKHLSGESRLMPQRATSASASSIRYKTENVNGFEEKSFEKDSQTVGKMNENAYSSSLKGRESELLYAPVSAETIPTETAKKVMNTLTKLTNGNVNIVLTAADMRTADGQTASGVFAGDILYLNANATVYDQAMFVGSHELVHMLEGTKEYHALGDFITATIKSNSELQKKYDINRYITAYANVQSANYSAETKQYEALTEMYADFIANEILSNENTVQRLINRNRNVVVRMFDWVRDAVKRLGINKDDRAAYDAMRKWEKLLSSALDAGKGGISLDEVEEGVQASKQAEAQEKTAERSSTGKFATARYNVDTNVFEIGRNSELAKRIQNSTKSKYTVIKEYLVEKFGNTTFTLSDGKEAIMDNRDAQELSHKADALRTAELADLKNLVEKAEYIGDPKTVEHPKFDAFSYYKIRVAYEGNQFEILINVGRAKNDKTYHIYAITNYNEKGAVGLLKNNPSRPVGNAIKDGSFNTIIRENSEKSTENVKKSSKNSNGRYSIDVTSPKAQRETAWTKALSRYVHRIHLSADMKAAIIKQYGEERAKRLFDVWESKSNNGLDVVTVHKELERDGFSTYAAYIEDFLMDMDSTFSRIAPKLYKAAESGKEVATQEAQREGKKETTKTPGEMELTGLQAQQVAKCTKKKVYYFIK